MKKVYNVEAKIIDKIEKKIYCNIRRRSNGTNGEIFGH